MSMLALGCGARTGLEVGVADGGTPNAAVGDAGRDAGPRDAGTDAGTDAGSDAGPPQPLSGATGVWVGPIPQGSDGRVFTIILFERQNHALIGYVAGGTAHRSITGTVAGGEARLVLTAQDSAGMSEIMIGGTFAGDTFRGIATRADIDSPIPVVWQRRSDPLVERRFLFWPADQTPAQGVDIALVTDDTAAHTFVSGGYVGRSTCDFSCGGGALTLDEQMSRRGYQLRIELESGGAPTNRSTLAALMDSGDPSFTYRGRWVSVGSDGRTNVIAVEGVRTTMTRSDHVSSMLAALGALADGIESNDTVSWPIASDFLHDGMDRAALVSALEAERARYTTRTVDIFDVREAVSLQDPLTPDMWQRPSGIGFHDRRTGTSPGMPADRYRDVDTSDDNRYRYLQPRPDRFLFVGNGR